jgi:prevent-host-death family protein
MAAGEFKAKCLAVLDEVKASGEPVLITKRGKPVARVASMEESLPEKKSILGRLKKMGTIHGDPIASEFSDSEWERIANEPWPSRKKRKK